MKLVTIGWKIEKQHSIFQPIIVREKVGQNADDTKSILSGKKKDRWEFILKFNRWRHAASTFY